MCHSPAGLQYAAWGWTCKDSGHCSTDFKNQSGVCKWYMDWFPKSSHHAVAQIGYWLDERITGCSSTTCTSHKARLGYQNGPFSPQNQWEENSAGFERPWSWTPHASSVFCTLLLFAERMKLEISVSAETAEYFQTSPWTGEAYGEQWVYVAPQQFLQHYFLCKAMCRPY